MAFRQIANLGRPVVHLDVDVDMVIRIPGWYQLIVPDPLQIGRQVPRPGTADQQVASEIEIEGGQTGIGAVLRDTVQPDVSGQIRHGRGSQIERDPAEEALVLLHMVGQHFIIRSFIASLQGCSTQFPGISPEIIGGCHDPDLQRTGILHP